MNYGEDFSERFWVKVDIREPGECWEWKAGKQARDGIFYGSFRYINRDGKLRNSAHRAAYELVNGPIPDGLMVRHKCDNGSCVNPSHLEVGTAKDNARDRDERGRARYLYGDDHHRQGGRPPQDKCKRGHWMVGWNIIKSGKTRRCRQCNRIKALKHLHGKRKMTLTVSAD